jgi:type IV secretory pathway TrbD component
MKHNDFINGYESGKLSCSVSLVRMVGLLFSGRIREVKVAAGLVCWLLGLLCLVGLSGMGFVYWPAAWAALVNAVLLSILALSSIHAISEVIVSGALADEQFWQVAVAECALWFFAHGESDVLASSETDNGLRDPLDPRTVSRRHRTH